MDTNQMDQVLINKTIFYSIKDVRSMQGLNSESYYFLVRVKCKHKVTKI